MGGHELEWSSRAERASCGLVARGQLCRQGTERCEPVGWVKAMLHALRSAKELGHDSHLRRSATHIEGRIALIGLDRVNSPRISEIERGHGQGALGSAEVDQHLQQ